MTYVDPDGILHRDKPTLYCPRCHSVALSIVDFSTMTEGTQYRCTKDWCQHEFDESEG